MKPELAILLAPWRAVYVEIPKAACSTLKLVFANLLGIDLTSTGGNPHEARFPEAICAESTDGPIFPDYFAFAFVRNPWDRLVSCYRDKIGGEVDGFTRFDIRPGVANCLARFDVFRPGMSFDDFVDAVAGIPDEEADVHFRSQYTFVTNAAAEIAVDFVGRFESLEQDFGRVERRLGLERIALPRVQANARRVDYAGYYTPRTCEVVARRFEGDLSRFGYCFQAA